MLIKRTKRCETEADFMNPAKVEQSSSSVQIPNGDFYEFATEFQDDHKETGHTHQHWMNQAGNIIEKYSGNEGKKQEALQELYYFYAFEYFSQEESLNNMSCEETERFVGDYMELSAFTGPCGEIHDYIEGVVQEVARKNTLEVKFKNFSVESEEFDEGMLWD